MKWLSIITLVIFVQYSVSKETATYQVSGIEIVDLIRGFKPKDNVLSLTKVTGDPSSLPDGIYFKPEDEALTGESKFLNYKGQEKKASLDKKHAAVTNDEQLN